MSRHVSKVTFNILNQQRLTLSLCAEKTIFYHASVIPGYPKMSQVLSMA